MSFTVVGLRDGHALEDAVRRGVADGLARLLRVPEHPVGVQVLLDKNIREFGQESEGLRERTRRLATAVVEA